MDPRDTSAAPRFTRARERRWPLRAVRELWWGHRHHRYIARLGAGDHRHPLDDGYVADAMARQIEEIRNLPEVIC